MDRCLYLVCAGLIGFTLGCSSRPAEIPSAPVGTSSNMEATVDAEAASAASAASPAATATSELTIIAWNVESGGADPKVISQRLKTFGADIYGLSEVHPNDFETYRQAVGEGFDEIHLPTGNDDRLQLIFSKERFELLERIELDRYKEHVLNHGGLRSPLAARLKDRKSGREYLVMVNHLARGNEAFRNQQAIGLREWARDQSMPCICVGDFNMDYEFTPAKGNQAFVEMLRDNVWSWVKPDEMIDSNWWDPEGDGIDNFDGSLLDLAFVSGEAKQWSPRCEVIVEPGDFPDDATTSDHRPIRVQLSIAH